MLLYILIATTVAFVIYNYTWFKLARIVKFQGNNIFTYLFQTFIILIGWFSDEHYPPVVLEGLTWIIGLIGVNSVLMFMFLIIKTNLVLRFAKLPEMDSTDDER